MGGTPKTGRKDFSANIIHFKSLSCQFFKAFIVFLCICKPNLIDDLVLQKQRLKQFRCDFLLFVHKHSVHEDALFNTRNPDLKISEFSVLKRLTFNFCMLHASYSTQ